MEVKGGRSYDNSRRAELARQTRVAVVDAARTLFLANGYGATTVRDIAEAAGVSFPTVYSTVGNKVALLSVVFDVAVAGDDEPVAIAQREFVRAAMADPDPRVLLTAFVRQISAAGERTAPVLAVIDEAAGAHPEIAALAEKARRELLTGTTRLAQALADKHALRPDLDVSRAADILWMLSGGIVHQALVQRRNWSPDQAAEWLTTAFDLLLLRPVSRRPPV